MSSTHIIFSHGFGVRADNRGLFTELSEILSGLGITTQMFDYNQYDETTKELHAIPFSQQAQLLQSQIAQARHAHPEARLVIIGQSQGSIIPALCDLSEIDTVIGVSPFFHTSMEAIMARYTKDPSNVLSLTETSRRKRSDGSTTVIPPEYWKERFGTDMIALYNDMAQRTHVTLIYPLQDELMTFEDFERIKGARIINLDGKHDFTKPHRQTLFQSILWELRS